MEIYYIKGIRPNGNICIFNGSQNPYDISLLTFPQGYSYQDKKDAIKKISDIKNSFVDIKWSIIKESKLIKLRIEWCEKYLKHYREK